jgi:hypothetical protein
LRQTRDALRARDQGEARPYAQKATGVAPKDPFALLLAGRTLVETGEPAAGLSRLEVAVRLDPGNLEIHLAQVSGYAKARRYPDARMERARTLELSRESDNVPRP